MTEPARSARAPDPTFYPVDEQVPENTLHQKIVRELCGLVERWLASRGQTALAGSSQFIYWLQHVPTRAVAPDVYVLPGVSPGTHVSCWKVWETGVVPSFALEVVSIDVRKDYELAPGRYEELGVAELVVFDPDWQLSDERQRWQVWRRVRGQWRQVEATNADRVRSIVLGCWLRAVGEGEAMRLRLGTGLRGEHLVPTEIEAVETALEAVEAEREAEHEAREAAEAEIRRLRDELAKLRPR